MKYLVRKHQIVKEKVIFIRKQNYYYYYYYFQINDGHSQVRTWLKKVERLIPTLRGSSFKDFRTNLGLHMIYLRFRMKDLGSRMFRLDLIQNNQNIRK